MKIQKIFVVLLFIFFIPSCDILNPGGTSYHNRIFFSSSRSGKEQLYMMNPDGSDIKQITSGEYWHKNGRWSPDAKKIVCNTEEGITTAGINMIVINSDGSNRKLLGYGGQKSWHPNGNKITFSYMPSTELGDLSSYIYIMNIYSTETMKITNNYAIVDSDPNFSPDGNMIAFSSDRDYLTGTFRSEIYTMGFDGDNQKRLTFTNDLINLNPCFSPDGEQIIFNSSGKIMIVNLDGSVFKELTKGSDIDLIFVLPKWSPDGSKVVFIARDTDGSARSYIYMVNIDGTNLHKVIDDDSVTSCDWSN
ncbi:MAG: DUF5050 domain-containing protein [Ignavibacteria bacterium]|jgi:TolB protein